MTTHAQFTAAVKPIPAPATVQCQETCAGLARPLLLEGFAINGQYMFDHKIGAGTYGLIYSVRDLRLGKVFAAKIVLQEPTSKRRHGLEVENKIEIERRIYSYFSARRNIRAQELDLDLVAQVTARSGPLREISLHLRVHEHPNIVGIHKVFQADGFAVITLLDYLDQGDLFTHIVDHQIFQKKNPVDQLLMKNAMLQLVDAMQFCEAKGIYHCDLKPENIMVQYNAGHRKPKGHIVDYKEIKLVLIDFGLAIDSSLICCNACRGLSFYMAPERLTNFNTNAFARTHVDLLSYRQPGPALDKTSSTFFPTIAGDIWSLGVLLINVACGKNPWPSASLADEGRNTQDVFNLFMVYHNKKILRTILGVSLQFNVLLERIFMLDPRSRISLDKVRDEILTCDFFHDLRLPIVNSITPPATDKESVVEEKLGYPVDESVLCEWLETPETTPVLTIEHRDSVCH